MCTRETINEFPVLFHFKGGWAGQCSHRLEVFDPPTHPTSRREGVSPCRAIERCFADSPFSRKKESPTVLYPVILVRFRDVLRISVFAYLYLKDIYTCDITLREE